jgi:hypothetical protein
MKSKIFKQEQFGHSVNRPMPSSTSLPNTIVQKQNRQPQLFLTKQAKQGLRLIESTRSPLGLPQVTRPKLFWHPVHEVF